MKHTVEAKEKMRQAKLRNPSRYWLGKKISREHNEKLQQARTAKGRVPPKLTLEIRAKISASLKKKYALGELISPFAKMPKRYGKNSANWRGGTTKIGQMLRRDLSYKLWRLEVLKRDKYICQGCGQIGGKLIVDHIKPFAYFPELRLVLDNGRTLCIPCHKKTDTYGCHPKSNQLSYIRL